MQLCYLYIPLLALPLIFKPTDEFWPNLSDKYYSTSYKFHENEQLTESYKLTIPMKERVHCCLSYNARH